MSENSPTPEPTTILGSEYYIHPADSSNTKLVNDLFAESNYSDYWKRSMMLVLSSRNKLCFVDGYLKELVVTDINYEAWHRCNDLVIVWLLFSLEKQVAKSIWYYKKATDLWKDLEDRSEQASGAQLFSLQ